MLNYLNPAGCLPSNDKKLELLNKGSIFSIGEVALENIG